MIRNSVVLLGLLVGGLLAGNSGAAELETADFYVSPDGSDAWSGTVAEPDDRAADGPFATLARARDAVRDLKKSKSTDIVVRVRGGNYLLEETVVFGLKDSGAGDATITYAAYPDEKPVFSSGREIESLEQVTETIPGLPKAAQGKVLAANVSGRFHALYDAEGLLPRARSAGFKTTAGRDLKEFRFPEGKLKNWLNLEDVEIIIRPSHQWMVNILPLVSVDEEAQVARTSIDGTYAMKSLGDSCWVENVLEELDQPGEWVLNTKEGKVYLWPRGESPVVAPQLLELIRVEGEIDEMGPTDVPVRNLCFRGLTFMHGDRYSVDEDDAGVQHDWDMVDKDNALVRLRGAENCVVEKCYFLHSGSGAVRVDLHGQENKIRDNHIEHIGGTGILLGGYGPGTKDVSIKNLVYNNHIHHVGEIYWHSPGILLWQSGENRIANNLIHNTNYCGMIICGMVTKFITHTGREVSRSIRRHEVGEVPRDPTIDDVRPYLHSHDNLIEYNEIHHAMEKLGDGNGIYIRGSGPGNVIRRNYIHHLVNPIGAQSGIRTDGGQMDTLVAENVIYKCTSQGLILKLNNRAENNIIAYVLDGSRQAKGSPVSYLRLTEGPSTGGTIKRNIFYHPGANASFFAQSREAQAKDGDKDYNIYYCAGNPEASRASLDRMQREGVDAHSLAVDPMFVDPENGDFRFKPDSLALKLGFVPIDLSKVGLRTDKE
ncbi:right-handed parallel beta-helix repeat-containing protein [Rubripirellula reticaptiva]|uniref:Right handed beta helix domain-containing protein n=1 Tax=Rubripirellula reticaptiva TaxID=2528013 RepID=A0A5C6F5N4_9BACT|nr:right-handed parallel beta-helix repeat-containing protein [Rubripirellula reticaptiva]TWU56302.1 hypothetical protein Poly59_26060 [Rubripirellula reticaptiva]